jgi:hypothetical protein
LEEARTLARQGKYEEALQKHLWLHENAIELQPSWSAVRLSFALGDWVELGKKYPKAREVLVAIRDKNTKAISKGNGSFDLFHETSAINYYLGEQPKTVALFKMAHEKYPDLAKDCYHVAEEDLVAQREYRICIRYIPDPLARFDEIRDMRNMNLEHAKKDLPRLKEFAEKSFEEETCRLIAILVGADRKQDAAKVRDRVLAVRDDPVIRKAIKKAIQRPEEKKGRD